MWRSSTGVLLMSMLFASAQASDVTLCRAGEAVAFSCASAGKTASLCAMPEAGPGAKALIYRYGTVGKVELEHVANEQNGQTFFATVSPATPGALVKQVWFNRGDVRYLLTECVGGACPYGAGIAVLKPDRVLMHRRCESNDLPDQAVFSRKLISFGDGLDDTRSFTHLIRLEDADNSLDVIYKSRRPPQ